MKPTTRLATTTTPDGSTLVLSHHDGDYKITVDTEVLMSSRAHESELELARLGLGQLVNRPDPQVLIGGLGMGYTLREALSLLPDSAGLVVAELLPDVVAWNQDHLGGLTEHPLQDPRVRVEVRDVMKVVRDHPKGFKAILLDVDNGPDAMTDILNHQLYSQRGIRSLLSGLHPRGVLAVWACTGDSGFKHRLQREGLNVRQFWVKAHRTGKARCRCIWTASRDARSLPPLPERKSPPPDRRKRRDAS